MEEVKKASKRVINDRTARRIQPNPIPPLNNEEIDRVADTINNAIEYAAALDLDR